MSQYKFEEEYSSIPVVTQGAIIRYLDQRLAPGGFLYAVLENDLYSAMIKADSVNTIALPLIVKWLITYAPDNSIGTTEKVAKWLDTYEE